MVNTETNKIIFYGTKWCGDCRRSRKILDGSGWDYKYIDIDIDKQAAQLVISMNNGFRSVPTILFPDGTHLVEPSRDELLSKIDSIDSA